MKTESTADLLFGVVREIQARKRAERREPDHALLIKDAVYTRVAGILTPEGFERVLRKLADAGRIVRGPTVRDSYVRVVEQDTPR